MRDFSIESIVKEFRDWAMDMAIKNKQIDGNENLQA